MTDLEEVPDPDLPPAEEYSAYCAKGTFRGTRAIESEYGFARCLREIGHNGPCDSGPSMDAR